MTTATAKRRPARGGKPATPEARFLKLLILPGTDGPGLLALTIGVIRSVYWLTRIDSPAGGRVFELRRFRGRDTYHVRLAHDGHTCTCPAWKYRGRCKHVDALLALAGRGRV